MKGIKLIIYIIIVITFCNIDTAYTQIGDNITHDNEISTSRYENLKQEIPFDKTKNALRPKPPKKNKNKKKADAPDLDLPESNGHWYDSFIGIEFLAYVGIFMIACLLLYFIFSNLDSDKKIDLMRDVDYIEDIEEVDTDDGYTTALREGDYRMAIRMHFLKALQILTRKNIINWQPEKTNRDYVKEIIDAPKKSAFRNIARIYENVWYGNHPIDRQQFKELDFHFTKFIKGETK